MSKSKNPDRKHRQTSHESHESCHVHIHEWHDLMSPCEPRKDDLESAPCLEPELHVPYACVVET